MKSFQKFLMESLNSPYKWKWTDKKYDMFHAVFQDSQNRDFGVVFDKYPEGMNGENVWEIQFGNFELNVFYQGSKSLNLKNTGHGDSRQILSTIMEILFAFLKISKNVDEIILAGSKVEGKARLYEKMIKKFEPDLKKLGFKGTATHDDDIDTFFSIINMNKEAY